MFLTIIFISGLIYLFDFNHVLIEKADGYHNNHQNGSLNGDFGLDICQSSLSEYSGVGKARNVTEYGHGYFQKDDLNLQNDDNTSIIVSEDWKANEILCNISNIVDYNFPWVNETFDIEIDSSHWSNYTDRPENVTFGRYNNPEGENDSIYIKFEDAETNWNYIDSHINYTINIPRVHAPFYYWDINFKYWANTTDEIWLTGTGGAKVYFMLYVDDVLEYSYTIKPDDLGNNTLQSDFIPLFTAEQYGITLPGTISLLFGVNWGNSGIDPSGFFQLFYDNITLTLSTLPKPSDINLNITDITNSFKETKVNDVSEGNGIVTLQGTWEGGVDGKTHLFGFKSNSSGTINIDTALYVNATSSKNTQTQLEFTGTEFQVENDSITTWTTYFPVSIPGTYGTNYYFNISKPTNWNITQVINPYFKNVVNDTIGAGFGNSTLTVPNNIIINGLWKIVAESPNYFEEGKIFRKLNSIWQENASFHISDTLKINGTIKTSLIDHPEETNITLKVYYPNETLWYQEVDVQVNSDGTYEFSDILVNGNSAVSGEYSAQIIWHDRNENMTQVGFSRLKFEVIHRTSLTAVNDYFELYAGDPLLLKVNFTDLDFNEPIPFMYICYNSTYWASGTTTYQGQGIYLVDLDTSSLDLGNYYFSFNATNEYYDNVYEKDLIHLQIIAQPLKLEVPHEILTATANSYFTCQINVTGGITGVLIWPANISTDWINPYVITPHDNGTFTLNLSTYNLPNQGISEIYTILISASKTFYGATSHTMTLTINPIQTTINVDSSLINTPINEIIEVDCSFNEEGSGALINGATCSVTWPGTSSVISQAQGFIVQLNTSTLSIDTYTAILKLEKAGFETAYKSITVVVEQRNINVNTIGFQDSIQAFTGDRINIKINLTEEDSIIYIENASVYYSWGFGDGFFDYMGNGSYELNLKLPEKGEGNKKMTLTISKEEGEIYKTKVFSFIIVISERPVPNVLIWILIAGVLILIGVLSLIGIRSYVILPRKRAKESKLLARTQRYKDLMNIEAILISQRSSGLYLFIESYYSLEKYKKELLTGFINAITILSTEIVSKEDLKEPYTELRQPKSIESLIELDFKHFYFLIGDYKEVRIIFILREKASDRFKNQLEHLLLAIDLQFAEELENWNGQVKNFEKILPSIIYDYFELYYKKYFRLNSPKHIAKVKKENELNVMENRVLNTIYSIIKEKEDFYLHDVIEMVEEKNKDFVIEAIESLIEKKIIISTVRS